MVGMVPLLTSLSKPSIGWPGMSINSGGFVPPPASLWLTAFTTREMLRNKPSRVRQGSYMWMATTLLHAPSMRSMAGTDVHAVSNTIVTVIARSTQPGPWSKSEATCKKINLLKHLGYTVIEQWECDWDQKVKTDLGLQEFLSTLDLVHPLNPRDIFLRSNQCRNIVFARQTRPRENK